MTLHECLLFYGGLAFGMGAGFLLSALFTRSKDAVAKDVLASLIELRRHAAQEWYQTREEFEAMIARADLAITHATE